MAFKRHQVQVSHFALREARVTGDIAPGHTSKKGLWNYWALATSDPGTLVGGTEVHVTLPSHRPEQELWCQQQGGRRKRVFVEPIPCARLWAGHLTYKTLNSCKSLSRCCFSTWAVLPLEDTWQCLERLFVVTKIGRGPPAFSG